MTFAGILIGCWLTIAAVAFVGLSGLGRLTAHGDVDADLGIVGEAELRVLVGERHEYSTPETLHARFARTLDRRMT